MLICKKSIANTVNLLLLNLRIGRDIVLLRKREKRRPCDFLKPHELFCFFRLSAIDLNLSMWQLYNQAIFQWKDVYGKGWQYRTTYDFYTTFWTASAMGIYFISYNFINRNFLSDNLKKPNKVTIISQSQFYQKLVHLQLGHTFLLADEGQPRSP